jgi:saccharopine dehydrogenase (NAD+, L-lysine-forming)
MVAKIGVCREDKSEWERRVPLTPQDAAALREQGIPVIVQESAIRAFGDQEFVEAGISVQKDLSGCPIILGIKEIPKGAFEAEKTYGFFAHVIKGQEYNMPMLEKMLQMRCTLIDYERVVDESNRRLIFFGWHAGVAGLIDTLWSLGKRLSWQGIANPFSDLQQTNAYRDLAEVKAALLEIRARIETEGLPARVTPLIVGVAGYGNVARGAQDMLDLLPVIEIEPEEVAVVSASTDHSRQHIYKAIFKERHMVKPLEPGATFELQDYYTHPEKYGGVFERYLPHLTVLVNAIFWTERYPRLVTKDFLQHLYTDKPSPRLKVIGDISCDVEGAIECTVKATEPGNPIYVYNPLERTVKDGYQGDGIVIMAVDILPSELPREASIDFSRVLAPFLSDLAHCDFSAPFEQCELPPELKRAMIGHRGRLTPNYQYLQDFLR